MWDSESSTRLILENGDWYHAVEIVPNMQNLIYSSHPSDYDSIFHTVDEYKIEGDTVLSRTILASVETCGEVQFNIRDNVVLELDIRERHEKNIIKLHSTDEILDRYRKQVEWKPMFRHRIKYLVLSQHPELHSAQKVRKLARLELERIKLGRSRFTDAVQKAGAIIVKDETGSNFNYPDSCPPEVKAAIDQNFGAIESFGITDYEMREFQRIAKDLADFLGD